MALDSALARAPRCTLVNVANAESMDCLFHPTQLTEKLQVNWNRLIVPGLSHQVPQFQSTSNAQPSGVEFYWIGSSRPRMDPMPCSASFGRSYGR